MPDTVLIMCIISLKSSKLHFEIGIIFIHVLPNEKANTDIKSTRSHN